MKLSTYIERLMERGWRREAAEEAAILAKEAGATWDPEEPEGGSEKPATILVAPLVKWAERRLAAQPGEDEADALGSLLEILELQTEDPEETELPERASFGIGLNGWKMHPESDEELTDDEAFYREAAARYNAWEILYQRARKEWPHTTLAAMDRHLAEERERLA